MSVRRREKNVKKITEFDEIGFTSNHHKKIFFIYLFSRIAGSTVLTLIRASDHLFFGQPGSHSRARVEHPDMVKRKHHEGAFYVLPNDVLVDLVDNCLPDPRDAAVLRSVSKRLRTAVDESGRNLEHERDSSILHDWRGSCQKVLGMWREDSADDFDVNAKDEDDKHVLHYAAEYGQELVVKVLIKRGAAVDVRGQYGRTPLHYAVRNGHERVVMVLLGKEADVNAKKDTGCTPLHESAEKGHLEVTRALIEAGADINAKNDESWTPLFSAVVKGNASLVKDILQNGADVNTKDECWTALHYAAFEGHDSVMKILLENGADVDTKGNYEDDEFTEPQDDLRKGLTPLHCAASYGHETAIKILLENGAAVDAKDERGNTPLHQAVSIGHGSVARLLLDNGTAVDVKNIDDRTALHFAANAGNSLFSKDEVVKVLLEKGGDVDAVDKFGNTAVYYAANSGRVSVAKILKDAAVDKSRLTWIKYLWG